MGDGGKDGGYGGDPDMKENVLQGSAKHDI